MRLHGFKLPNTLNDSIQSTAKMFGGSPDGGVIRLALSPHDLAVKEWFANEARSVGCEVLYDSMGNQFAIFPGKNSGAPTAMGSHLDTQPTGGKYDGILGVLSGLEVLKTLKVNNYVPKYPLAVVNWMNEEGARFPMSMMSSSVWAGATTIETVEKFVDQQGISVGKALDPLRHLFTVPCSADKMPLAAHFELHIEQGPILEAEKTEIGLVQGIQAYKWLEIRTSGRAAHTGTTPMNRRKDAMVTAAQFIVKITQIATEEGGLASIGQVTTVLPSAVNVITEEVRFTLDIRHPRDDGLATIYKRMTEECPEHTISAVLADFDAVHFNDVCKKCIADAAKDLGFTTTVLASGAGHDSGPVASRCPTAMIFVPSKDGISHNPAEYTTPEQCHSGYEVLLEAVLAFDDLRTK